MDGNIGVIEGVRKLSDGIRAAEQQAENLQSLEIALDDKKTRYASNTLPKIRLDYGEINDREQERLKIIEDAARKKQQISDWRKDVLEKITTKSPVAYCYSDDGNGGIAECVFSLLDYPFRSPASAEAGRYV